MSVVPVIELLRHGHTGQRSYRGQIDDALSEQGWQQLRATAAGGQWDAVVSSTLQRCAAFAHELATQRGCPLRLDPRLVEYHFGQWQGVPIEDIARDAGDALGRFWSDPVAHPPPGGEPFAEFRGRLAAALDQIAAEHAGSARRVLVVTHGGAIRALRCMAEQRPFGQMVEIEVAHASLHPLVWPPRE
ncbi:MAG TPA: histidine phosphatase family protein [Stenotrophomonas sp.]|nr:histidine phosphatase family protein [Stenotrophomonas sp.]